MSGLLANLDAVLEDFCAGQVEPAALATDAQSAFPVAAIAQFRASGLSGLLSAEAFGGAGGTLRDAVKIIERIARLCGSTAMVATMHYCGAVVIEAHGDESARAHVGQGQWLTTLAFSEAGSRSHFWAPGSTATRAQNGILLNARKSWVTSAYHADMYVWSSRPVEAEGFSSIWLVPRPTPGLTPGAAFDALGLRGNDSVPVTAENARIDAAALLGEDGKGADVMLGTVLPVFSILSAAVSLGLMNGAIARTISHMGATKFEHLGNALMQFPTARAFLARMQVKADMVRALLDDAVNAVLSPGPATMLRVLEVKAAAGETATEVLDIAMRVCGGAAFRKEDGIERFFRDARAATVMAPTTDQLYDFIGRALCGMDLFA